MSGINGFLQGWRSNPESLKQLTHEQRNAIYWQGFSYYRNLQFSRRDGYDWSGYLSSRELYKHTRLIYNPVPAIVDFYADNIWQAARNEKFESLVTPLSDKTDEALMTAIAQLDQWGNFLAEKSKIIRYGAATGNVLIEGEDSLEREKVTHKVVWAGYVSDLTLDDQGNVLSYTVEYDVWDNDAKRTYRFKKVVDRETFRYFKNDLPFDYPGKQAVMDNPYGFCFAVWIRHTDDGGNYGLPACVNLDKVDEVNSLASHLHDNIHKEIESGKIIGVDDPATIQVLTGGNRNRDGSINEVDPRLERVLLAAKGQVSVSDLSGLLKLAEAHPYLRDLLISFGDDYPELEYRQILKEKGGTMSGVALERLLTPAQNRLDGAQANYNQQLIKLRQMQIAVAGYRVNNGDWSSRTAQQSLFKPFNLDSYAKGVLDFQLKHSVLIKPTEDEIEETLTKKASRAKQLEGVVDRREQLSVAGYSDEDIDEILRRFDQERARNRIESGQAAMVGGRPPIQLGEGLAIEV